MGLLPVCDHGDAQGIHGAIMDYVILWENLDSFRDPCHGFMIHGSVNHGSMNHGSTIHGSMNHSQTSSEQF